MPRPVAGRLSKRIMMRRVWLVIALLIYPTQALPASMPDELIRWCDRAGGKIDRSGYSSFADSEGYRCELRRFDVKRREGDFICSGEDPKPVRQKSSFYKVTDFEGRDLLIQIETWSNGTVVILRQRCS
jgi:hypothetical protein